MFDLIFFFKQKTAYEMRISDWSSDVCSSDLQICMAIKRLYVHADIHDEVVRRFARLADEIRLGDGMLPDSEMGPVQNRAQYEKLLDLLADTRAIPGRSEEHTSELQSLMRISYAVFCLKKKKT